MQCFCVEPLRGTAANVGVLIVPYVSKYAACMSSAANHMPRTVWVAVRKDKALCTQPCTKPCLVFNSAVARGVL